jgi:exosome complex component RRP45
MKDADPSTNEREFLLAALKDGARIDGRKFYDFRTLRLTFGAEYGAVEVQLGNTRSALLSLLPKAVLPFHQRIVQE